jgi:hypothetical protein
MAKTKLRPWTKEDVRTLKTLARQRIKTTAIARKVGRSRGSDLSEGMGDWCDAGARLEEEKGGVRSRGRRNRSECRAQGKPGEDSRSHMRRERRHQEDALDEALKDTFPASHPVSCEPTPPAAERDSSKT